MNDEFLAELQVQSQQMQTILLQKHALDMQAREIEKALEEIEKHDDEIYRSVGPVLVKTGKEDIKKELGESREEISIKISALERQEKRLREKIKESQQRMTGISPAARRTKTGSASPDGLGG